MTTGPITLTVGWISRHTPPGAGVDGRNAAVIDIAQDLLLRDLHERGSLDALVFMGGTSLRNSSDMSCSFSSTRPAPPPGWWLESGRGWDGWGFEAAEPVDVGTEPGIKVSSGDST